jgi:hypothetical protein
VSAQLGRGDPVHLKKAVWGSEPELLALWHGARVPVWPGDRVRFYEPADGALIFVAIDDGDSTAEAQDGDV